jgi:ABC-2 type transport system permease protein
MNATLLIARRELSAYLRSMTGYVIAGLVLLTDGLLFNGMVLSGPEMLSSAVLSQFFIICSGLTMISSVFISMRLIAEERQVGTLVLLTSSPVHDWEIVLGKYLASVAFMVMLTLATLYMPALIFVNGKVSLGHMFAGYLGVLLLGAAALAIGTFGSVLARSQVLAAIISGALVTAMVLCWNLAKVTEKPLSDVFNALAIWNKHFPPFSTGSVHMRDVAYFLMVIYFALFASIRVMEARRWR